MNTLVYSSSEKDFAKLSFYITPSLAILEIDRIPFKCILRVVKTGD